MKLSIRRASLAIVPVVVLSCVLASGQPPESDAAPADAPAQAAELDSAVVGPVEAALKRVDDVESLQVRIQEHGVFKMEGQVVDERTFTFNVAAERPNRYALSFTATGAGLPEGPIDAVVSDGETLFQTLTPDAYLKLEAPESFAALAQEVNVTLSNLGPIMVALTMPTVDASRLILHGVESAEVVESETVANQPASHIRLKDADATWDLWVTTGDAPLLRRLQVDLTEQLRKANPQLAQAEGFSYVVDWELSDWKLNESIDPQRFEFDPMEGATGYSSAEEYQQAMSGGPHPLLGEEAPAFTASTLAGDVVDLARHKGKDVVLLDFWATWCPPCVAALPIISEVAEGLKDQGVVFYAINLGEEKEEIETFLKENDLSLTVPMDTEGEVARKYRVTGIPQTVLIGRDGRVQAVHVGFASEEQLQAELTEELTALAEGESLLEQQPTEDADEKGAASESAGAGAP